MNPHQLKPLIDKAIQESGLQMLKIMKTNKKMFQLALQPNEK